MKPLIPLLLAALLGTATSSAWAHGPHHARVGVYIGTPWVVAPFPAFYPPYYPPYYPRAYYPPVVVTQPEPPPVYVEQAPAAPAAAPAPAPQAAKPQGADTQYWYYCTASAKYYPYVRDCPEGWLKVVPDAPSSAPR